MSDAALRLDKWLVHARFARHRSVAQALVAKRRVRLNGRLVDKPHSLVRLGDVLTLGLPHGVVVARVAALGERRGPAPEARALYERLDDGAAAEPSGEAEVRKKPLISSTR